jgi:hypothetical protein
MMWIEVFSVGDAQIDAAILKIYGIGFCANLDPLVWYTRGQLGQVPYQPTMRQGVDAADDDPRPCLTLRNKVGGGFERGKCCRAICKDCCAYLGQFNPACQTMKQGGFVEILEFPDLQANGSRGYAQFGGCGDKAAMTGASLEGSNCVEWWQTSRHDAGLTRNAQSRQQISYGECLKNIYRDQVMRDLCCNHPGHFAVIIA